MRNKNTIHANDFKKLAKRSNRTSKRNNREKDIQAALSKYIKTKYKGILFFSDLGGVNLSKAQRSEYSYRSGRGFPDFWIFQRSGEYIGLCLELKKEGTRIYKKDGSFADSHLQEQSDCMSALRLQGWSAHFAIGYDEAQELIDNYLKPKK